MNGIRAAFNKNLTQWIQEENPDIICLQESKAQIEQIDAAALEALGYYHHWHSAQKKGYSGVGILSKTPPRQVHIGCQLDHYDCEGRIIQADFENFSVISVYVPSATNIDRLGFKMEFCRDFSLHIEKTLKTQPNLIICGDFNICHEPIDIHDPVRLKNVSGFLPMEREWMSNFLSHNHLTDSYRFLHPDTQKFSWWSYRAGARGNNKGWRLDYHFISESLLPHLRAAEILTEAHHSDHCPVMLELAI